jgi:hypothetical protein
VILGGLASLLAGAGVAQRFARPLAIGSLAIAAIALLATGKCAYDRSIVSALDDRRDAELAGPARRADDQAATERRAEDSRTVQEVQQIEKVIKDAPHAPLSDARRDYYRCVRLQQQARAAGDPPPAC